MSERFTTATLKEILIDGVPARRVCTETLRDLGGGTFRVMTTMTPGVVAFQWLTGETRECAAYTVMFITESARGFAVNLERMVNATQPFSAFTQFRDANGAWTNILRSGVEPDLFDGVYVRWEENQSEVAVLSRDDALFLALALYSAENG